MKDKREHPKILNAAHASKYQDIRANFLQLIKEYHPDKTAFHPDFNKRREKASPNHH